MSESLDGVLNDSRVTALRDLRERHAARARAAQARYRRFSWVFLAAMAAAASPAP